MPLYEYLCGSCGHRFERIRKFSDPPVVECPSCGAHQVEKQVSSPAIQFKGSGWYITDYAKPAAGKAPADASTGTKTAAEGGTSGSSDSSASPSASSSSADSSSGTKPDTKADAKPKPK